MKYKFVIVLLLGILILMLSGVTYSVFTSDASLEVEDQDLAKFVFNVERLDKINLPLVNLEPGETLEYPFSVTNEDSGVVSNVTVLYELTLKTFHFMPLEINLYRLNGQEENLIMTCDESYSRNANNELVCNTESYQMDHSTETLDNYVLKVSFPLNYNSTQYADLVDFIDLEITSSQKSEG